MSNSQPQSGPATASGSNSARFAPKPIASLPLIMDRAYVQSKKEGSERRVYAASFDCAQVVDGKLFVAAEREQPPDPEDEAAREARERMKQRNAELAAEPELGVGSTFGGSDAKRRQKMREERWGGRPRKADVRLSHLIHERVAKPTATSGKFRTYIGREMAMEGHYFVLIKEKDHCAVVPLYNFRRYNLRPRVDRTPELDSITPQSTLEKGLSHLWEESEDEKKKKAAAAAAQRKKKKKGEWGGDDEAAGGGGGGMDNSAEQAVEQGEDDLDFDLAVSDDEGEDAREYERIVVDDGMQGGMGEVDRIGDGDGEWSDDEDGAKRKMMELLERNERAEEEEKQRDLELSDDSSSEEEEEDSDDSDDSDDDDDDAMMVAASTRKKRKAEDEPGSAEPSKKRTKKVETKRATAEEKGEPTTTITTTTTTTAATTATSSSSNGSSASLAAFETSALTDESVRAQSDSAVLTPKAVLHSLRKVHNTVYRIEKLVAGIRMLGYKLKEGDNKAAFKRLCSKYMQIEVRSGVKYILVRPQFRVGKDRVE